MSEATFGRIDHRKRKGRIDLQGDTLTENTFEVAQRWRTHLPVQETRVPSLGREDPLEEGMATHSSLLAWRIPWTEEPGGLQSMRPTKESDTT